ncbi:alpha/beta fold hydrolase [Microbacterium sp. EYE_5]|uniref:alpha/beta fold hydrolase n=1 Tax=unclassified Microbacterium TaxID=2609290 RepID=UPI002005FC08|nr:MULTISPECIES: alpha/beta hydrolase [unclassified Microbacterium]MCK6080064.1 alpha/beta fold hydrolase [Microbacterium sp. EYE_382]MCK6085335.1 alpha/beta fold hydrolase [Microbacterium sp. EYE_384]MCK6122440.1 alpha/beta fold hydrolase [Microbacterium sp. EYE_80]MCK6126098.1 alpha/beta fold hydrolase [Microbacterium sp. EYE_79]MCK6141019.1 alpha/beta fold hydrolase [Microbacterium sp. EYE_39]
MSAWNDATVDVRGGVVAAQSLGAHGPAVVLLGGATWSRDWWPEGFCRALVDAGLRVIRFDPRDTGGSTLSPPGTPEYDAEDMAADVVAVLDAFQVGSATVVGLSAGGGIAQEVAGWHPSRVAGLVLMSTTAGGDIGVDLPGPADALATTFAHPPADPDWSDRGAVVDGVVESERPYAGPGMFDEAEVRRLAGVVWDRTPSMASGSNHFVIAEASPALSMDALRGVRALIIHGTADPLFPVAHGEALAEYLRAPLLTLDGVGHQIPPASMWPEVVQAIAEVAAVDQYVRPLRTR